MLLGQALQKQAQSQIPSSSDCHEEAWASIDTCLQSGDPDGRRLSTILSSLPRHASEGSAAQRVLVDSAWSAGLQPHASVFNVLLRQLQREGRVDAVDALQAEMSERGVRPDASTAQLLATMPSELERMRTNELKRLLRWGAQQASLGEERVATTAGWDMWDRLLCSGQARPRMLLAMLRLGCSNSEEQSEVCAHALEAGGRPLADAHVYSVRITRLQLEGRPHAAIDALMREMREDGVRADHALEAILRRSKTELSAMRTRKLMDLLTGHRQSTAVGTLPREEAWKLYRGLLAAGVADYNQLGVMLAHGTASHDELHATLDEADAAGLVPHTHCLNAIVSKLQLEGRSAAEIEVALDAFLSRGLSPDRDTLRIVQLSDVEVSKKRTSQLVRWVNRGREGDELAHHAAFRLFATLCERGKIDRFQVEAMRETARQVERGTILLDRLPDAQRHLDLFWVAEAQFSEGVAFGPLGGEDLTARISRRRERDPRARAVRS